jgi:hypothetical protein
LLQQAVDLSRQIVPYHHRPGVVDDQHRFHAPTQLATRNDNQTSRVQPTGIGSLSHRSIDVHDLTPARGSHPLESAQGTHQIVGTTQVGHVAHPKEGTRGASGAVYSPLTGEAQQSLRCRFRRQCAGRRRLGLTMSLRGRVGFREIQRCV